MKPASIAAFGAAVLLTTGLGGWYYMDQRIRSEIDARLAAAVDSGRYDALEYDTLDYGLDGSVEIGGLLIEQQGTRYRLDRVAISEFDYSSENVPRSLQVQVRGLQFPDGLPQAPNGDQTQLGALLARVAHNGHIPLELDYRHDYQPEAAHQLHSSIDLRVPALLQLQLNGSLRQVPLDAFAAVPVSDDVLATTQALLPLVENAEIPQLSLQLQDQGLVQAMMEIGAGRFNATPADYRQLLVNQARNAWLFLPQNAQQLGRDAGEQLAGFLEQGGTLHLSLQPEFDGRIEQLQTELMGAMFIGDFAGMAELLNFSLRTEAPARPD